MTRNIPLVLSFAASDPTSGAGLQADCLTIAALGAHPLTVLTGITAQNTQGVQRFEPCAAGLLKAQLDSLQSDGMMPQAMKLGVLGSQAAVDAVLQACAAWPQVPLVFDPVMASGRGDAFGMGAAWHEWLPALAAHTTLITPNWLEAQALTGSTDPQSCAETLHGMGFKAVLIKGEHRDTTGVENVLYQTGQAPQAWPCERLPQQYHGSGCTLASAVAASLAQGANLEEALGLALEFTWQSLSHAFAMGQGQWVPDRLYWVAQCEQV